MTKPGIGSAPRRREDQRLVTGAGTFGDDFTLPGQTFAAIARSPHAHAILQSIETTKARELSGVLAVLTAADYLADGLNPLVHSPFTVSPPDITLANRDESPSSWRRTTACPGSRRFVGEGVVLVVAEPWPPRGRPPNSSRSSTRCLRPVPKASTRPGLARSIWRSLFQPRLILSVRLPRRQVSRVDA